MEINTEEVSRREVSHVTPEDLASLLEVIERPLPDSLRSPDEHPVERARQTLYRHGVVLANSGAERIAEETNVGMRDVLHIFPVRPPQQRERGGSALGQG